MRPLLITAALAAATALAAPTFVLAQGTPQTVQLAKLDVIKIATGYRASRFRERTQPRYWHSWLDDGSHVSPVALSLPGLRVGGAAGKRADPRHTPWEGMQKAPPAWLEGLSV